MKKFVILFCALCVCASMVFADEYVSGHYRSDGTYIQGYYRSDRNNTNADNYSTYGNTNPYTGSSGSTAVDYSSEARNYGEGHTIYTGPRGGQYYINSNGNKTYVPKR